MKPVAFLFFTALLLASCGNRSDSPKPDGKDTLQTSRLSEKDIYAFDKVADYMEAANEDQKKAAKQKFLNAIDIYRNKKEPVNALAVFRESLLFCPSSKTYYELGNALLDSKKYEEATEAYHMAERLNYSPLSKALYNLACAYSLLGKEEEALQYVQLAIQNGYDNRAYMLKDSDLEFVRKSSRFMEVYETSYGGATSPEVALFDLFEANFKPVQLPFTITVASNRRLDMDNTISYDFERFVPELTDAEFSRDVGDEFFYVAKVHSTPDYVALVYAGMGMWAENAPVYYYLATYDPKKGSLIDKVPFGGMPDYDSRFLDGTVKSDLSIEVKSYIPDWEKDPSEAGYINNKIVGKSDESVTAYRIDAKGRIVESNDLIGMRK